MSSDEHNSPPAEPPPAEPPPAEPPPAEPPLATTRDIILYRGPINSTSADELVRLVMARKDRKTTVMLILTTAGGEPGAAFRIARALQRYYKHFLLFVPGYCKSAGTLVALGAHEIVLGHMAELGPLDVQVPKHGEIGEQRSGLIPSSAMTALNEQVATALTDYFYALKFGVNMPAKMAADLSASVVQATYGPIFAQIDPLLLGELARAMRVAQEYGSRLARVSKNTTKGAIERLINGYPSHDFVIDISEARALFKSVREPEKAEVKLAQAEFLRAPTPGEQALVSYFDDLFKGEAA